MREFHQIARTGKTRVWRIKVEGKYVTTEYGELGGKMQSVVDEGVSKNVGRSNEVTPEEDAVYLAERAILKKTRNGYRPVGEEAPAGIDWSLPLPENLRFFKPTNTLSKGLLGKLNTNKAWLSRKRDGEMMVVVKAADGKVDIYSRTMLLQHHLETETDYTWADRFQGLVAQIEEDDRIPPKTIFLGDMVDDPEDDNRWDVATFMKRLTPAAQKMLPPLFYCWDIAFWDGHPSLQITKYADRYDRIHRLFGSTWSVASSGWVVPIDWVLPEDLQALLEDQFTEKERETAEWADVAMKYAALLEWEGWVVVDPEATLGDKAFNFRGKTDRPGKACGKLKPVFEDDFVALFDPDNTLRPRDKLGLDTPQGKWGKGNNRNQVGSVSLWQYGPYGLLHFISYCGGGITDEFRAKYSDPASYPLVIKVEYTDRTYKGKGGKTDALTYPRVVEVRDDKEPKECLNRELSL